jgi:hypothetical protein
MLARSDPYLARQLSAFDPARVLSQQVNQCCVSLIWMVMQAKESTQRFILVRAKEGPTSSGEGGVLYFLAPKCLRRGYKL